jgi:hypothetical protein
MKLDMRSKIVTTDLVQNGYLHNRLNVMESFESIEGYRGKRSPTKEIHEVTHTKASVHGGYVNWYDPISEGRRAGKLPLSVGIVDGDYRSALVSSYFEGLQLSGAEVQALEDQLYGAIPPIVSVPNMILELPQTLHLWKSLREPVTKLLSLGASGVRQRLKHGSNAALSQHYGLFTLVSDVKKLFTSTKSIHSEVQRLKRLPNDWSRTKARISTKEATAYAQVSNSAWSLCQAGDVSSNIVAYVAYDQRKGRFLDDGELPARVARDLYGFSAPWGTAWEAIPFSFIADQFFPIGDYLKNLDSSEFSGSMDIRNVCTCVKAEMQFDVQAKWDRGPAYVWQNVGRAQFRSFSRKVGLPEPLKPLDTLRHPDITQSVLDGAIVLQRLA